MKKIILSTVAALGLFATTAGAQGANCGDRTRIVERLQSKYGETRQSIGLGANNQMMEVFAPEERGNWSILFTNARGVTCLVASGQSYENVAEAPVVGEAS